MRSRISKALAYSQKNPRPVESDQAARNNPIYDVCSRVQVSLFNGIIAGCRMRRAILVLLFLTGVVEAARQDDNKTEADTMWEKVITAKGGKERLHTIANVVRSSAHAQSLRGKSCRDCPVEELFVFQADSGTGATNGQRFWVLSECIR